MSKLSEILGYINTSSDVDMKSINQGKKKIKIYVYIFFYSYKNIYFMLSVLLRNVLNIYFEPFVLLFLSSVYWSPRPARRAGRGPNARGC